MANKIKPNGIRVALATCHDKRNFGSMLQAYATQAYLEAQGYDVRTIDKTGLGNAIKPGRMDYYRRNALDMQMYREKAPFVADRITREVDVTGTCDFLPINDPKNWADALCAVQPRVDSERYGIDREDFANYDIERQGMWLTNRYLQLYKEANR